MMTHKERFEAALKRQPVEGHVPHFELMYFPTMEKFHKVHPWQRRFYQWDQMTMEERIAHMDDIAELYVQVAETYQHDAIVVHLIRGEYEYNIRVLNRIQELTDGKFFIFLQTDPTFSIPDGSHMIDFSVQMYEEPEVLHEQAKHNLEDALNFGRKYSACGLVNGMIMPSDYCLNTNPFFSREQFEEFIVPTLTECIAGFHEMGYYCVKHTDGNIMPIVDLMVQCKPDALHSIDPQAKVDLSEVKRLYGNKVCLIGNVNCGLLQTGTDEEVEADVRRALKQGMEGWGYVFASSNCIYTGMPLRRYEMMQKIWWEEGIYPADHH